MSNKFLSYSGLQLVINKMKTAFASKKHSHSDYITWQDGEDISIKQIDIKTGAKEGIAPLDDNGLIPSEYLPSYVDDIIEAVDMNALYDMVNYGRPEYPQTGKIYVTLDDNNQWRWSGRDFVQISKSIAVAGNGSAKTASRSDHYHSWDNIVSKPPTFPPSTHNHTTDITKAINDADGVIVANSVSEVAPNPKLNKIYLIPDGASNGESRWELWQFVASNKGHRLGSRLSPSGGYNGDKTDVARSDHSHDLNSMINNLSTGDAVPEDNSFFISQWNDGSRTSYHRRPFSTLWSYINNKCKTVFAPINHASTSAAYGIASQTVFGHLKLYSSTVTPSANSTSYNDMAAKAFHQHSSHSCVFISPAANITDAVKIDMDKSLVNDSPSSYHIHSSCLDLTTNYYVLKYNCNPILRHTIAHFHIYNNLRSTKVVKIYCYNMSTNYGDDGGPETCVLGYAQNIYAYYNGRTTASKSNCIEVVIPEITLLNIEVLFMGFETSDRNNFIVKTY